jgi:hypothetical protein
MFDFDSVISEAVLLNSKSARINKLFDFNMKQVFTPKYYAKIDKVFDGAKLQLNEFSQGGNIVAYTQSHKLYVNAPVFYSKSSTDAIVYVLHEMIHLLGGLPQFKEIKKLEKELYSLIKPNLKKSFAEFLTGKKQALHSDGKGEILSYLMNKSLDWSSVKSGTKELYIDLLKKSNIFNLNSSYFKFLMK